MQSHGNPLASLKVAGRENLERSSIVNNKIFARNRFDSVGTEGVIGQNTDAIGRFS